MKKKHLILPALIALQLFLLLEKGGTITFYDIVVRIFGVFFFWGIFVWGYDNPEAKR